MKLQKAFICEQNLDFLPVRQAGSLKSNNTIRVLKPHKHTTMKLGRNLFKKDQSIWGKPMIEYDKTKMNELFSEIHQAENTEAVMVPSAARGTEVSLETELYLMLHS